jgi:7-cyano-7-deazaguanine synthase
MKTLLLLSGGLDSTVVLADLLKKGRDVETLTFKYGQTHPVEIEKAKIIADLYNVPNTLVELPIPKMRTFDSVSSAFVPARNLIFLSVALNYALNKGIPTIAMGVNQTDEQGFPDCTSDFVSAFKNAASYASPHIVHFETPLINLEKHEIVKLGVSLNVDFSITNTCYHPINKLACGVCESCLIRKQAFKLNNMEDCTRYAKRD